MFEDFRTTQMDNYWANSMVQAENVTTEKLHGLVIDLREIIIYVIKKNIANFVNFKAIHSFIGIIFSKEFIKLQKFETYFKQNFNVT